MQIKACKTSMYNLVAEFTELPIMKNTRFQKSYRSASYFLEWCGGRAFLSPVMGTPLMSVTTEEIPWKAHRLTVDSLLKKDMIQFESEDERIRFVENSEHNQLHRDLDDNRLI